MSNAMEKILANMYKLYLGSNLPKDSFKLLEENNNKSLEFILLSYPSFSKGEYQLVITPTRYIFIDVIIDRRRETYLF